jgi:hypothetical protein
MTTSNKLPPATEGNPVKPMRTYFTELGKEESMLAHFAQAKRSKRERSVQLWRRLKLTEVTQ